MKLDAYPLEAIAARVGTPFYFYDAAILRAALGRLAAMASGPNLVVRYAMKANSARAVLQMVREAGLWIDAVSGNEVLRAARAGFPLGASPPVIMLTSDVYRDNSLDVILRHGVLPNVGSPGQIGQLVAAGYRGPIAMRENPGFGHGHVQSCDTGGPSSKHGIWFEDPILSDARKQATAAGLKIVALHAHIGTGPDPREFDRNARKLVDFFAGILPSFPDVEAVNFGGGIPHPYRPGQKPYDLDWLRPVLTDAVARFAAVRGRPVRVEIEPGRYLVATAARFNVDDILTLNIAGFQDAVRHRINELVAREQLGVVIESCQVKNAAPRQLADDFRQVTAARQNRDKLIQVALGAQSQTLNEARAQSVSITNSAESARTRYVSGVQSETAAFTNLLAQFQTNTALYERMKLAEAMPQILSNADKYFMPQRADGQARELRLMLNREPVENRAPVENRPIQ